MGRDSGADRADHQPSSLEVEPGSACFPVPLALLKGQDCLPRVLDCGELLVRPLQAWDQRTLLQWIRHAGSTYSVYVQYMVSSRGRLPTANEADRRLRTVCSHAPARESDRA